MLARKLRLASSSARCFRRFCSSGTKAEDILNRVANDTSANVGEVQNFDAVSKTTGSDVVSEPNRDPLSITIPNNAAIMEEAVAIAILERRRHQYLQEYPGGPIDRYLPPSDPYAFLIEDSKLTESERVWQKIFVVLPWLVFAAMVASPFGLIWAFQPGTEAHKRMMKIDQEERRHKARQFNIPAFKTIPFHAVVDVIERPSVSLILLFSNSFESKLAYPTLAELDKLFRKFNCPIGIVAIDLSKEDVSEEFREMYPSQTAPYLQIVAPEKLGDDADGNIVIDYRGKMKADHILRQVARHTLLPDELQVQAGEVDAMVDDLHDELFSLMYVDDREPHPSVFHRIFSRNNDKTYEKYDFNTELFDRVWKQVSLSGSVRDCTESVKMARETLASLVANPN